jgi:hypothetical protein
VGSFNRKPSVRRTIYLKLASDVESQLRQAYAKRHEQKRATQAGIAGKLGVDRSAVHRRLMGRTNMTIETIADLVWALGHCIRVEIFDPEEVQSNDFKIDPTDEADDPSASDEVDLMNDHHGSRNQGNVTRLELQDA